MQQRIVIPELVGGVSRQPDGQRFPNQVEEADNVNLHLSRGVEKRAGSSVVAEWDTNNAATYGVHWINRSSTEKYFIQYRNDATTPMVIRKLDGTLCTLSWTGGSGAKAKTYVTTASANLRMVTVDDTTIVVNTSIAVALDPDVKNYLFGGTEVELGPNAHNKESWEEFDLPPTVNSEYWYANSDALGHSAGAYQAISITTQPWYQRVRTRQAGSRFEDGTGTVTVNTMPIRITQTGDTTFVGSLIPWGERLSGDSLTNKGPSFVGKKITDLAIHRNRLWFSAGETVSGSASGELYSFFNDSYDQVVDSDPIDVKLSSAQVTKILWMASFQRSLVVFTASGQQYEIRAKEAMTPTTVQITPSTAYTSPLIRPVIIGSQLYWSAPKGPWSQLLEYLTDEATAQSVATDAAAHVDGYLPSTLVELKAAPSNDMLFAHNGTNKIFVNFMFWQGQKKIQSAWCTWTLPVTHAIISMDVYDDYLYVVSYVTEDGSPYAWQLHRISLRNSDAYPSYVPRFDSSISASGGSWNATTRLTTFTVTKFLPNINSAYLGPTWGNQEGSRVVPTVVSAVQGSTVITLSGNYSAHAVDFGVLYDMDIRLSRQYIRDQQGTPAYGSLQLKQLTVHHRNTGYFELVVDPRTAPASDRQYKYTGKQLGSIGFITNTNVLSDRDSQNFKIMASSSGVDLYLRSDSPAPCNITGLEFAADFVVSKRSPTSI